jgi:hypothetical protein
MLVEAQHFLPWVQCRTISERQRRGSRLYRSGDPEAERVKPHIDIALSAEGRAHVLGLVAPRATADDTVAWIAAPAVAVAVVATLFGASQGKSFTQHIQKRRAGIKRQAPRRPIHDQSHRDRGGCAVGGAD